MLPIPSKRIFMDLETEAKPWVINHEDPKAWFLTDLEKDAIHEPPEPLFICKYYTVHCNI